MQGGSLPDAVFAANDMMALGCLYAFSQAGVKVPEQVALAELGCDYLQGFLFSRPLPPEQVPWLLLQKNSDKQIIPIGKIHPESSFISQKNHA